MSGYIIAFIIGVFFGILVMCIMRVSGEDINDE